MKTIYINGRDIPRCPVNDPQNYIWRVCLCGKEICPMSGPKAIEWMNMCNSVTHSTNEEPCEIISIRTPILPRFREKQKAWVINYLNENRATLGRKKK